MVTKPVSMIERIQCGVGTCARAAARRWQIVSDAERWRFVRRSVATVAASTLLMVGLPTLSGEYADRRAAAESREEARLFAAYRDGGAAIRARPDSPALLRNPWMVTIEQSLERQSQAALGRYAARDRDQVALRGLSSFQPAHLERAERKSVEHHCLAEAVYYEARSERVEGQLAVAEVVMNRVRDHRYPNSVCDVVYQGATRTTGCQFTFTCDGSLARKPRGDNWRTAQAVAAQVLMDLHEHRTGSATHYHADYVNPIWNAGLIQTHRIGTHIFYRFPRGAEWAEVRNAVAERRAQERRGGEIQTVSASSTDDLNTRALKAIQTAAP